MGTGPFDRGLDEFMTQGVGPTGCRLVRTTLTALIILGLSTGCTFNLEMVASIPSESFTVGIGLESYAVTMLVSTEEDTIRILQGWVDVHHMKPGETVTVQIEATGYYNLYTEADPFHFRFEDDGRQFLNFTVVLKEDAPITDDFHILISAEAKTYLHSTNAYTELVVTPTFQITADAEITSRPSEGTPGESTTGKLLITNTGSIYGEYQLKVASDPDDVVEEVGFTREADLTPGFHEEFEFTIVLSENAEPGTHTVTISLWAHTQYDLEEQVDTITLNVRVTKPPSSVNITFLASLLVILSAIAIAAFVLRRKA